ncbi:MAG: hypothetical protein EP343_03660 [Deltaproteobacteria bacterium]|nr:MAG: hypothetical protein EP343_03660 [Deltaproteobacteria bacterium]
MSKAPRYADLHLHPSMRLYHHHVDPSEKNYWPQNANQDLGTGFSRWVGKMSEGVSKVSQTHFDSCIEGHTRVLFDSLYPIERGFVRFRKHMEWLLPKSMLEALVVTASGVSSKQFHHAREDDDYFSELLEQYEQVQQHQGPSPCGRYAYKIVNSFDEMDSYLDDNDGHIAIVLTIEGAHVLGCGTPTSARLSSEQLREQVLGNLDAIKAWENPPFFMTFAHHFWNQLCGHAATFPTAARLSLNQQEGLNQGFTELGWDVMQSMLSRDNGRRILIDTRHMSARSRIEYYEYVQDHNRKNPDDRIPVISSHAATNGFATMEESYAVADTMAKKKNTPFCSWSLNISAEEMQAIHDSGGLVGVILDKGRLSGIKKLQGIERIQDPAEKRKAFSRMILDNLFELVQAVDAPTAWDVLMLGSDLDGVITHIDCYDSMSTIPQLREDLTSYLQETQYRKELWYGMEPEEIFEKFFETNAQRFLKQHFQP